MFEWQICYTEVTNLLHRSDRFVAQKWQICYTEVTDLLHGSDRFVARKWQICCTEVTYLLHGSDRFVTRKWQICYAEVTDLLHGSDRFVAQKWHICCTEVTDLLHGSDIFVTRKWQICYRSQEMFENPTVNFSALRNSCVKIACCSSQLIFTFLSAGSSIQDVSEQFVWCIHLSFVNRCSFNRTNKSLNQKSETVRARFKQLCLGNHS